MTISEMLTEFANHNVNYSIHYNCYSKRYRVTVPWLDIDVDDKEVDAALRLALMEMVQERRRSGGQR